MALEMPLSETLDRTALTQGEPEEIEARDDQETVCRNPPLSVLQSARGVGKELETAIQNHDVVLAIEQREVPEVHLYRGPESPLIEAPGTQAVLRIVEKVYRRDFVARFGKVMGQPPVMGTHVQNAHPIPPQEKAPHQLEIVAAKAPLEVIGQPLREGVENSLVEDPSG